MRRALLLAWLALWPTVALASEYTPIEGTRVSLRVPEGFSPSETFPGIGRESDLTSILVTELGTPFTLAREHFLPEALAAEGVTLHQSGEVVVDGHEALLVHATQDAAGVPFRKWLLLLGDDRASVLLTATAPLDLEAAHQEALVETLSSARWAGSEVVGPDDAALRFSIDVPPPLRIVRSSTNALVLSDPDHAGDALPPLVVVGASRAQVQIRNLAGFARERLEQTVSIDEIEVTDDAPRELGGLPGHEIHATARDVQSERAARVTQLLATDGERFFIVQGIVDAETSETFAPLLERVITSFTLRE